MWVHAHTCPCIFQSVSASVLQPCAWSDWQKTYGKDCCQQAVKYVFPHVLWVLQNGFNAFFMCEKIVQTSNCLIIPHRQMRIKIRIDYFFTMIWFLQVICDSVLMQIIESESLVMLSFMLLNPWMLFLDYKSIETTWKYWFMFISKFGSQTSLHHQTLFEVKGDLGLMNEFGSCSQTFHYIL